MSFIFKKLPWIQIPILLQKKEVNLYTHRVVKSNMIWGWYTPFEVYHITFQSNLIATSQNLKYRISTNI